MLASFRSKYVERGTEFFLEFLDERRPALGVKLAHAANVACEMSFIHEVREHGLEKVRGSYIHGITGFRLHDESHQIPVE